jgi:hypothetical protein
MKLLARKFLTQLDSVTLDSAISGTFMPLGLLW